MNEEQARLRALYAGAPYLPPMGRLDEAVLPVPPLRAMPQAACVLGPSPDVRSGSPGSELGDPTDQLTRVVGKALTTIEEILDDKSGGDNEYCRMKALQLQAAQTALSTQAKVDDTQLKRRQVDMMPKLLEIMARMEKENPKLITARVLESGLA
jgi:hypothetical protein